MRPAVAAALALVAAAATAANQSPLNPEFDARNWASIGRTAGETHYSPLTEINRETVGRLKLAWTLDLDVGNAQSTPLAVDGVIYIAAGYSMVYAVDAQTGKVLWQFDPGVTRVAGKKLRAGAGVRGLAYSAARLFVGTHDGRLIALDAKKGTEVWSTPTLDASDSTFISGAPRVFKGKVAIGFGDSGTTPGRISAFDVATGKQVWSWSTQGAGGAIWNAITYDPDNNRVYAGTGNARGPDAARNTFACSVVALNADTGQLDWQYQSAPGDRTQCDGSTDITLATITIDAQARNVILYAPKDGSFHVIDRTSGKAISEKKLGVGAHNHFAQSFSPRTGLVYVPTTDLPPTLADAPADAGKSALVAWDPVKQRPQWAVPTPGAFSGGVLSTAGDLVFQGQSDGYITAYSAAEGRRVWAFYSATAALGAPISFAIGKRQYISILNGPTQGTAGSLGAMSAKFGWDSRLHPRRLLTFVLDGAGALPATPRPTFATPVFGTGIVVDEALAKEGAQQYAAKCQWCHGAGAIAGGGAPDLRASLSPLVSASFAALVRTGVEPRGMPKFEELTDRELEALRHYLRAEARKAAPPEVAPPEPETPAPSPAPEQTEEPDKPPGSLQPSPRGGALSLL
ncbi:MAG TPA: PQQ-binding-like beta-propeller repeat protein [Steroidobacteraceae bacterium]|nr:PQQ-binding-like beta-propeller repeat protein [Steroidobacteraceae bacterium]